MRSKEFEDIEYIEPIQSNQTVNQIQQTPTAPTGQNTELVRLSDDGSRIDYINWKAIHKAAQQFDIGQKDSVRMIAKILFLFGSIDDQLAECKAELEVWRNAYPNMSFDGQTLVEKKDA